MTSGNISNFMYFIKYINPLPYTIFLKSELNRLSKFFGQLPQLIDLESREALRIYSVVQSDGERESLIEVIKIRRSLEVFLWWHF